jgi:hypothetical protein
VSNEITERQARDRVSVPKPTSSMWATFQPRWFGPGVDWRVHRYVAPTFSVALITKATGIQSAANIALTSSSVGHVPERASPIDQCAGLLSVGTRVRPASWRRACPRLPRALRTSSGTSDASPQIVRSALHLVTTSADG